MAVRRSIYLLSVAGGLVFYWAYREWLSWLILVLLLALPWFSLLVSLPAMLTSRGSIRAPRAVKVGTDAEVRWNGHSRFPLPPLEGKLLVRSSITGRTMKLRSGDLLPTSHCHQLEISLHRPKCCDYLGLIGLPIRKKSTAAVLVRPRPVALEDPPDMSRYQVSAWRPKPGGGFSENHELRLYRPGDNLRQVHWKLSAKTGKLIVREPMEAILNRTVLTMELRGEPELLDRKLGQLLWMSRYLLQCELPHCIHVLTGTGMVSWQVLREGDENRALDELLQLPAAAPEAMPQYMRANWRYHIGGDGSEH
jgi:hypothetical protein